jgi:hypothetical protein
MEELPKSTTHPDKYRLIQYFVNEPYLELRGILHLIRYQNRPSRNTEFVDQKSIVLYLNRKGGTVQDIQHDRIATLGKEAIAYRTMMKYLYEAQISPGNTTDLPDALHIAWTIQTKLF